MTPELERALATPHARRLIALAADLHRDELAKLAKKNSLRGYPEVASQQKGDSQFIREVVMPAFGAQTGLELDSSAELRAYFSRLVQRRLRQLKADISRHLMDERDELADQAVDVASNFLGQDMARIAQMIAERSHHDGLTARSLQPEETLARVLRELTGAVTPTLDAEGHEVLLEFPGAGGDREEGAERDEDESEDEDQDEETEEGAGGEGSDARD